MLTTQSLKPRNKQRYNCCLSADLRGGQLLADPATHLYRLSDAGACHWCPWPRNDFVFDLPVSPLSASPAINRWPLGLKYLLRFLFSPVDSGWHPDFTDKRAKVLLPIVVICTRPYKVEGRTNISICVCGGHLVSVEVSALLPCRRVRQDRPWPPILKLAITTWLSLTKGVSLAGRSLE